MTTRSPYWVGRVETRRSMLLPSTRREMRPSSGRRRSEMSISPMILMRRDRRGQELARHGAGDLHLAVHAVADLEIFLARLDVDVRRAAADGVGEQRVDKADDRRLVALADRFADVHVVGHVLQFDGLARPGWPGDGVGHRGAGALSWES